jgi:hypothetical protein
LRGRWQASRHSPTQSGGALPLRECTAHADQSDQASDALGIARHTAKFHLDKLAEEGLLDISFKRLSERRGPGAGRPTKLYARSSRQLSVILPERRYDLADTCWLAPSIMRPRKAPRSPTLWTTLPPAGAAASQTEPDQPPALGEAPSDFAPAPARL